MSDHDRLHERLMDGTADPGMYPDHWYVCLGMEDAMRAAAEADAPAPENAPQEER